MTPRSVVRTRLSPSGTLDRRPSTVDAGRRDGRFFSKVALAFTAFAGLGPVTAMAQEGPAVPPPGKCSYLQPQIKQCSVSGEKGVGTFDVVIAPPAALVITFEEPVLGMQPPPSSSYKAIFSEMTATIVPVRKDPIAGATVHFDTANVHVTLNLKLGSTPDTQLLILDPRRAARDTEVERRVNEALAGIEERANERANQILLAELSASGLEVSEPGASPHRQNNVVLRAEEAVRLGRRRFLLFSIENRTGDPLQVRDVRLFHGPAGKERELAKPSYELSAQTIGVGQEVTGVVALPLSQLSPQARARLRVEMADPERSVELGGIKLR
jgi:hypothetical protein